MEEILRRFGRGEISIEEASKELKLGSIRKIRDFARIDINRSYRTGIPEVIFAEGKSNNEVADIAIAVASEKGFALISRVREAEMIKKRVEAETKELDVAYNAVSSTIVVKKRGYEFERHVKIGLIAAGTADIPVAEEAAITAEFYNNQVERFYDIGAIVYQLKAIPWQIPDFSVERYFEQLKSIHEKIRQDGYVDVFEHRFFIIAEK